MKSAQTSRLKKASPEPDPQALATLVYTSGTTGRPKGVMLSHRNILWNAEAVLKAIPGYREDVYLSVLPLSYVRAHRRLLCSCHGGQHGRLWALAQGSVERHQHYSADIAHCCSQIYEGIRTKMQHQLEEQGRLARLLVNWTLAIGWERFPKHKSGRSRLTGGMSPHGRC